MAATAPIVWDIVRKFDSHLVARRGAGVRTTYLTSSPLSVTNVFGFTDSGAQPKAVGLTLESVTSTTKAKGKDGKKAQRTLSYNVVKVTSKTATANKKGGVATSKLTGGRARVAKKLATLTQGAGEGASYRADLTVAAIAKAAALLRAAARSTLPLATAVPAKRASKKVRKESKA